MNSWFSNSPASQMCPQNSPREAHLLGSPFSFLFHQFEGRVYSSPFPYLWRLSYYNINLLFCYLSYLLPLFKGYSSLAVFSNKISRFPWRCRVVSSRELRVDVKARSCIRAQCCVHLCFVWYSDLFSPRQISLSTCDDVGKYPPSPGSGLELR